MGRTSKVGGKTEDYDSRINSALKDLHKTVRNAKEKKSKADECLSAIVGFQDRISGEKKLSNYHKSKLKTLYGNAQKELQIEADSLRKCLTRIADIRKLRVDKRVAGRRAQGGPTSPSSGAASSSGTKPLRRGTLMVMLQQQANTLPLFIGRLSQPTPPLCGAMPSVGGHVCKVGDAVAALVHNSGGGGGDDGEPNWILAEVVKSDAKQQYDVEDVDEEQKERHAVDAERVIPLPLMRANPDTDPDAIFPQDAVVLALYPQTTCFYKGVVEQVPLSPTDDYLVAFEDSSYPSGYSPPLPVPQRYVVAYKNVVDT